MSSEFAIGPGAKIGNVRVEREIGSGAFGAVYLARDLVIGREVALKVMRLRDGAPEERDRARFLGEARVVGGFKNPHIVTLYQVHPLPNGDAVLEMEYVEGGSLEEMLGEDVRLPADVAGKILRGMLAGLSDAHDMGIVHGDMKPANVLFARDGTVKIADFGLARVLADPISRFSESGTIVGTPFYMAPEVIMGERHTLAADVWSVGVMLHRMLAGSLPFRAPAIHALFFAIQNADAPPLPSDVPSELARIVERCLSKRAGDRPASAARVLALVEGAADSRRVPPRPAPTPERRSPTVGREEELARFGTLLDEVAGGRGAVALVAGEAGIGKTALVQAVGATARGRGFRWIEAMVTPVDGMVKPLIQAARAAVLGNASAATLDARLSDASFGSAALVLKELLSSSPGGALQSRGQMVWALEHLLRGLAAERPLVLLVEDLHQAEDSDVKLVKDLARRLAGASVLLIATFRTLAMGRSPADSARLAPLSDVEGIRHFDLGPLRGEALYRLIEERVAGGRVAPEVVERIVERTGGNPFFSVEMFAHLRDAGALVRGDDGFQPGPGWESAALPRRLVDLLAQRLRGLPESTRRLLDVAAVDGVEFDGEAVAVVLRESLLTVLRRLQRLYREQGLIIPSPRGFRFASAMLRDVIYDEVAPELRKEIHRQLAQHLESRGEGVDPERLGVHWERAGRADLAAPYLVRAARLTAGRQESQRAIDLFARAGLVSDGGARKHSQVDPDGLLDLAMCYANRGRRDEAERVYDLLLSTASERGDDTLRMRTLVRRAHVRLYRKGLTEADEADLRRATEALPASNELGRACYLLGVQAKFRGQLEDASRWFTRADQTFAACSIPSWHASALDQMASIALRSGRLREAEDLYAESARISTSVGQVVSAAISQVNRVAVGVTRGELDGQEERLATAARALALEEALDASGHATAHLARVRYAAGNLAGAQEALSDALRLLTKTNFLPGLLTAHLERAHLRAIAGDLDGAGSDVQVALGLADRADDLGNRALAWAIETQRLCFSGDLEGASAAARNALTWADGAQAARADVFVWLAEACLYGLPTQVLGSLPPWLATTSGGGSDGPLEQACALWRAMQTFGGPGADPGPLRVAAQILMGPAVGARRAALRVAGGWLLAEVARREGDLASSRAIAIARLSEATALGHVWLELGLLQFLTRLSPTPEFGERRRSLIDRVAKSIGSSSAQDLLRRHWGTA